MRCVIRGLLSRVSFPWTISKPKIFFCDHIIWHCNLNAGRPGARGPSCCCFGLWSFCDSWLGNSLGTCPAPSSGPPPCPLLHVALFQTLLCYSDPTSSGWALVLGRAHPLHGCSPFSRLLKWEQSVKTQKAERERRRGVTGWGPRGGLWGGGGTAEGAEHPLSQSCGRAPGRQLECSPRTLLQTWVPPCVSRHHGDQVKWIIMASAMCGICAASRDTGPGFGLNPGLLL